MLETEEDMLAYFDVDFGHAINATYIKSGVSTAIKIILNREIKIITEIVMIMLYNRIDII